MLRGHNDAWIHFSFWFTRNNSDKIENKLGRRMTDKYKIAICSFSLFLAQFNIYLLFFLIPLISFLCGIVIGWTYTNAGIILKKKKREYSVAPSVYAYDLIGGSIGALLFSFFLLPVFGITLTIFLLVGMSLLGYLFT